MTVLEATSEASAADLGEGRPVYRGVAGHYDEAVDAAGRVRPHWQQLFAALAAESPASARHREDLCRRLLKDYGVTYSTPGAADPTERPWQLDTWPLVISAEEWPLLSRAVAQRARLLNLILRDIYGPRRLLSGGDLPPEIILANPAFLRAASNIVPPAADYLSLLAVDVARSPTGQWWVVGDRTDTPAGAGYALENRIVTSRVHPELIHDCRVERLGRFFAQLRDGLLARATPRGGEPRVVILTPGPYQSTYFEQVYLSRYLGFPLVEGEDLTVRDQGVFLKTLSGLLPVDVILRRVGSNYCDPLELRDDSLLGVPGLLQAARAGKVVLANAIGVGVVESPALLPFLPGLARKLLGEELLMPPVATWWCGHDDARAEALANLDRLVIKHAFPQGDSAAILPETRPAAVIREQILARSHSVVAQEYVNLSTAPAWQDGQLAPEHLMIRLYAVATGGGDYAVMPGGLTRAGSSAESIILSTQAGGGSKDTWVLADGTPDTTSLLPNGTRTAALSRADFILSSRLADNLFWLGRYMERIEFGCRMARCLLQRMTDVSEQGRLGALSFLLDALAGHGRLPLPGPPGWHAASASELHQLLALAIFSREDPLSVAGDMARVARIATAVRDRLSTDSWRILRGLADPWTTAIAGADASPEDRLAAIDVVLSQLLTFSGQAMDGMTRDRGWRFLDMGRRLERAADLADLIRFALVRPVPDEDARLHALLEVANSAMTYRSRYVFGPDPAPVLDLLLADEANPRSVAFQLATLYQHVRGLAANRQAAAAEQRIVDAVFSDMRLIDVDALVTDMRRGRRSRLSLVLKRITRAMEELSRTLTRSYLTHVRTMRNLRGPAT